MSLRPSIWDAVVVPVALALVVTVSGCSFMATRRPDATYRPAHGPPDCTTSQWAPNSDLAATILTGLMSFGAFTCDPQEDGLTCLTAPFFGIAFGAIAVATGMSTAAGYRRVGECRDAHARYREYRDSFDNFTGPPGMAHSRQSGASAPDTAATLDELHSGHQ